MRIPRSLAPLLLPLMLAQCGGGGGVLPPFETVPIALSKAQQQAASAAGKPPTRIGICYNTFTTTAAQVRSLAEQACEPGTLPRPVERDFELSNCPLLQPARATFACVAKAP